MKIIHSCKQPFLAQGKHNKIAAKGQWPISWAEFAALPNRTSWGLPMPSTNPENQVHHRKKNNLQNHITSREHDPEQTYRVNRDREGNCLIRTIPSLHMPNGAGNLSRIGAEQQLQVLPELQNHIKSKGCQETLHAAFPCGSAKCSLLP